MDAPDRATSSAERSASPSSPDPLIGRIINDRFRIVALIARGGMGKVYRAEQAPLGREVALKVLNPNYSGDANPEFHKRFYLEASITAKLTHPNTVSIFDYGRTDDGIYFIVMELLEGKTLHRALREGAPFEPARALHIARQICRALREAHGLGVVHRDLKPANVFLVQHGEETDFVKVLDFGLVKNVGKTGEDLTQTGLFMGSPKYMSPEQIRGEKVDGRADIYALGVILYEMLTGKVPFDRPNPVNILMAHVHEPPPPMRQINPYTMASPLLEQVVMKCLAKDPSERFANMDELLVALKQVSIESGHDLGMSRELSGLFRPATITGAHAALSSTEAAILGDPLRHAAASLPAPTLPPDPALAPQGSRAPLSAPPPSTETPTSRPRLPLIIAGISLAVLVVVGIVALRESRDISQRAAGATVHVPPSEPVRGTTTPASGAATAEMDVSSATGSPSRPPSLPRTIVVLRSEPPGATVTVRSPDGIQRTYGPTPVEVEWSGEEAQRGREVTLRFEMENYHDFVVTRRIMDERLEVHARLDPLASSRPSQPRAPRRTPGHEGSGPVGPVKGYKLDPY